MIHVKVSRGTGEHLETIQINLSSEDSILAFKEAIQRALNCWPDAHPEMKELGDMLMHGKILQDYWAQRTDIKGKVKHPDLPKETSS